MVNALITFENMEKNILYNLINQGIDIYIDDILINSVEESEY
jgi:hypothetical protein